MDLIYESSELAIIVAAGVDETYGLSGVSLRSKTHQPIVSMYRYIISISWSAGEP
jgi:hypothetical protein